MNLPWIDYKITLDILSFDGLDGDVLTGLFVVPLVHVAVLTATDLSLEHVIIDYFWHGIMGVGLVWV